MNQTLDPTGFYGQPDDVFVHTFRIEGLRVVDFSPRTPVPALGTIRLVFNTPVDSLRFDGTFITLSGPGGVFTGADVQVTDVSALLIPPALTGTVWNVTFPTRTVPGAYTLNINPNIQELQGTKLDQDNDGNFGEDPQDRFIATFLVGTPQQLQQAGIGGSPAASAAVQVAPEVTGSHNFLLGRLRRRGRNLWIQEVRIFRVDGAAPSPFPLAFLPDFSGRRRRRARLLNASGRSQLVSPGSGFVMVNGAPGSLTGVTILLRIRSVSRPRFQARLFQLVPGSVI
jgi:hypothetical protein